MNKCGIYKIENLKNRKKYIGQSINIEKRWKHHINTAFNSKNKNYNNALYCAFRKYGVDSFKFTIIEICDKSNLNEREKYWIKYYNSYNDGYNMTEGGEQPPIKQYLIAQYDLSGKLINIFKNSVEAENKTKICQENIRKCCRDKKGTAGGYQWRNYNGINKISPTKINLQKSKPVIQYDKNKNKIREFISLREAERITGISYCSISKCCKGKAKTAGGYLWEFLNN